MAVGTVDKKFKGWSQVFGCFMIAFIGMGLGLQEVGLYMFPVITQLGLTVSGFSWVYAFGGIGMAIGTSVLAKPMDRGNMKVITLICCLVVAVCYLLFGRATQLWHWIVLQPIMAFCQGGLVALTINIIMTNWFIDRRGTFMGIVWAGSSIGGIIFIPVIQYCIDTITWRTTYMVTGIAIAVILIPIILFVLKRDPKDVGALPYTKEMAKNYVEKTARAAVDNLNFEGITYKQALKTPAFWLAGITVLIWGTVVSGVMNNVPMYLTVGGLSTMVMATVLSLMRVFMFAGNLGGAYLFDKVGTIKMVNACSILFAASTFFLTFAGTGNTTWAMVFGVIFGLAQLALYMAPGLLASKLFGKKAFAQICGILLTIFYAGCFIGPVVTGYIYDLLGKDYNNAWYFYSVLSLVGVPLLIIAAKSCKKFQQPTEIKHEGPNQSITG